VSHVEISVMATDEQHGTDLPGLKAEMRSLVDELNSLSTKNDELMTQREQDAEGMDEMEAKVLDYKKKYDAIRIELRNLKGEFTCDGCRKKMLTDSYLHHVHLQAAF